MEGIVIAIIIALFSFAAEKEKKQRKQSGSQRGVSKPVQRQKHIPPLPGLPGGSFRDLGKSWNEMFGIPEEHVPESMVVEDCEGKEFEDRKRTGNLDYIEQSSSSEGICDEHTEQHNRLDGLKDGINITEEEDYVFEITEDNIINSIIMAEILGPPKALKRRIG